MLRILARIQRAWRAMSAIVHRPTPFIPPDPAALPLLSPHARVRQHAQPSRWSDDARREFERYLVTLVATGATFRVIAGHLNDQGLRTQHRRRWSEATVEYYVSSIRHGSYQSLGSIRHGGVHAQRFAQRLIRRRFA